MLIELEFDGMGLTRTGSVAFIWKERNGQRRCALFFDKELTRWIHAALRHRLQDGLLIAHAAFLQLIGNRLGTTVESITIPEIRDSGGYRMVVRFNSPAGGFTEDFLPSDATAIALCTGCKVLIEEAVLERASPHVPSDEELRSNAGGNRTVEDAADQASTLPKDKLPQS